MPKQGVVGIALNVDYDKALKEMVSGFNQALTQISNRAKKIEYAGDVKEQIKGIKGEIKGFSDEFRAELKKINDQQIDSSGFKKFEADVTERFENIEKKDKKKVLKHLDYGTTVQVMYKRIFWAKIECNGTVGYMRKKYLR